MTEFIALGGAFDPQDERPGIGGSAYALIHERDVLLVDCGFYPNESTEDSLELNLEEEPAEEIPLLRRVVPKLDFARFRRERAERALDRHHRRIPLLTLLDDREVQRIFVVITHAHGDHIGALPLLVQRCKAFEREITIFLSEPTKGLAEVWWRASLELFRDDPEPLFNVYEKEETLKRCITLNMRTVVECGPFRLQLFPAGHILGASSLLVTLSSAPERSPRVFFTGDLSFDEQHTVAGAPRLTHQDLGDVDYLVTECTKGGEGRGRDRLEQESILVADVVRCLRSGGRVLFGALAFGRAQEIFAILESHGIPEQWPVYFDGLAQNVARVYLRFSPECFTTLDSSWAISPRMARQGAIGRDRSRIFTSDEPCVVIAPAGMYSGGRAVEYASLFAPQAHNLIAITSYQNPCTPGFRLKKAKRGAMLSLGGHDILLNAQVKEYHLSGHASGDDLAEMVSRIHPSGGTLLVHGDTTHMDAFARRVPGCEKAILGKSYQLD